MQYGNPYFAQPFQQIQPYQDRLAQLQNSYQQAIPYGQTQIQQPMPQVPQCIKLQWKWENGLWKKPKHMALIISVLKTGTI